MSRHPSCWSPGILWVLWPDPVDICPDLSHKKSSGAEEIISCPELCFCPILFFRREIFAVRREKFQPFAVFVERNEAMHDIGIDLDGVSGFQSLELIPALEIAAALQDIDKLLVRMFMDVGSAFGVSLQIIEGVAVFSVIKG